MGLNVIGATHPGVIFGRPPFSRMQQTLEKQLSACVPFVLDGHVGGMLQAEGVRLKNKAGIASGTGQLCPLAYCQTQVKYNLQVFHFFQILW